MLNQTIIEALAPQAKQYQVPDGDGLFMRVSPAGSKVFYYEFRQSGRKYRGTIGEYPSTTLEQARAKVKEAKTAAAGAEEAGPMESFAHALERYQAMKTPLQRANTVKGNFYIIKNHVLPRIGSMPLISITAPVLVRAMTPIYNEGKTEALKKALGIINRVLDWAVLSGALPANPCARVSSYFISRQSTEHHPAIEAAQLPDFFKALFGVAWRSAVCTELYIVFTAASLLRGHEVIRLQWAHIDEAAQIITVPGEIMKMGRAFRLPITPLLNDILQLQRHCQKLENIESPYIWARHSDFMSFVKPRLVDKLSGTPYQHKMTLHGFRATARSWLADSGVDFQIAEACLAHLPNSQVVQAYQRTDFLEQRRPVMTQWGELIRAAYYSAEHCTLRDHAINKL